MNVVVIDLGVSNIRSLTSALSYLGIRHVVTDEPAALASATHAILPGVGAFDAAMQRMHERGLTLPLRQYAQHSALPLLGVCLGMQLLCESSDEGQRPGLGVMPGHFSRLEPDVGSQHKVPHVGFSTIYGYAQTGLFKELGPKSYFYFTHSYALSPRDDQRNVALCDHSRPFVAAFQQGNLCGVQFHPEKSQSAGLRLISNFLELA